MDDLNRTGDDDIREVRMEYLEDRDASWSERDRRRPRRADGSIAALLHRNKMLSE